MTTIEKNQYRYFVEISSRWMDNDVYQHINNVTYYSFFDTAVNDYLVKEAGLDFSNGQIIAYVVASNCEYREPLAFPDQISVGVRVNKLGNSSVEYGLAIFKNSEQQASAYGSFTHVFVERESNQSARVPDNIRAALAAIQIKSTAH